MNNWGRLHTKLLGLLKNESVIGNSNKLPSTSLEKKDHKLKQRFHKINQVQKGFFDIFKE